MFHFKRVNPWALFTMVAVTSMVSSDLAPLNDQDLSDVTGQAGLSVDADLITAPFATTLINAAKEGEDKFIAISDIELNMSFTNLLLDADGAYANGNPAVVMTLPDRIEFGDAANPTNIGSLKVSWTEDGSNPTSNVVVPREYLVRQGVVNNPGDHISTTDATFETYAERPMVYRFTHNQTANVELDSLSNGTYNAGTGQWTWGPVEWNVGSYEYANMTVNGQIPVTLTAESNLNNVDCDNGEGGDGCFEYPDAYIEIIDKQSLAPILYVDDNDPVTGGDCRGWGSPACQEEAPETATPTLGNPSAPQANREIGSVTLQGGFDVGGRVVIIPQ